MKSSNNHFLLLYPTRASVVHVCIVVLQCKVTSHYRLHFEQSSPAEAFGDFFPTDFNWAPTIRLLISRSVWEPASLFTNKTMRILNILMLCM